MRNVRLVDNIINFYYKIVECCIDFKKNFEKIISILQFSNFEKNSLKFMASHLDNFWEIFGKNFFEICENFFKNCTTVYKAGFSKVGHLYNLVTKKVTKYPILATLKILKIVKKSPFFEKF